MASFMRKSSKPCGGNVFWCKKHPKHRQSPGVCSLCLCERLSHATKASSSSHTTRPFSCASSPSSLSSYYSSSSASSCPSPLDRRYRISTREAKGYASFYSLLSSKSSLMKSRSVAFVPRIVANGGGDGENKTKKKKNKKGGFLSKFVGRRRGNERVEEGFVQRQITITM